MITDDTILLEPPVLDWDPYSEEVLRDPLPFFEALHKAGPVARIQKYDVFAVGRYDECIAVLNDYERFTASGGIGIQDIRKPGDFRIPNRLLETDPPNHTRIRNVLAKILSPIVIRGFRAEVEKVAEELVDSLLEKGEFEAVHDMFEEYVLRAFPGVVGVRLPREETLVISEMRFNQSGPPNELYHRAMKRAEPYMQWFEDSTKRENVEPDSLADLLFKAETAGELDEGMASNMTRSFVGGGVDSTISGIGGTIYHLANDPEQWELVKSDRGLQRVVFDEGIRMVTPFHVTYRTTRSEVELGGVRLDADTKVGVYLGAANRDPRKWENPNKFDANRRPAGQHVALGMGDHACIGQMIARMEAECLVAALAKKVKAMEIVEGPTWATINQMRTLKSLRLRLIPL